MAKDSNDAEPGNEADARSDNAHDRLDQIRRNLLATAEGVAVAVLGDKQLTGVPEASLELRASAQRLFIESARLLVQLEAGAPHPVELGERPEQASAVLSERIMDAIGSLSGEATKSNQSRALKRAISAIAQAGLPALEEAEEAASPRPSADDGRIGTPEKQRQNRIAQQRATLVEYVLLNASPQLAERFSKLTDPIASAALAGVILDAIRAAKTVAYQKKETRQVDAMAALLRALDLSASARSMKGRDA
jgi:hypothetical protein